MPTFRGTIVAFDSNTYRAAVRLDGSTTQVLSNLHTNRMPAAAVQPGRRCIVDTGDHGEPEDAVVVAVWAEGPED